MAGLPSKEHAKLRLQDKDDALCEEILEVLKRNGRQRVLLAGKVGIGKTRLAKKVGKYAEVHRTELPGEKISEKTGEKTSEKPGEKTGEHPVDKTKEKPGKNVTVKRHCFLTLCLHLNKKFEDEWSLYENIASQLSVYSDFEETEVDDRDEDEEEEKKDLEALLDELKKKIVKEIEKREVDDAKKVKDLIERTEGKPKKSLEEAEKKAFEAKAKKDRFLLLIIDDEGSMTLEDDVMKGLNLEKFLLEILKDENEEKRLKILVTRRERDEKPAETEKAPTTKETESQSGEDDGNNDTIEEVPERTAAEDTQDPEPVKSLPTTEVELQASTSESDKSKILLETIKESTLRDIFWSIVPAEWSNEEKQTSDDEKLQISDDEKLISKVVKRSKMSPAAIVVLANSLKQIILKEKESKDKELKVKELKEKIEEILSADRFPPSEPDSSSEIPRGDEEDGSAPPGQGSTADRDVNSIMHLAYELLKYSSSSDKAILDCFWHSLDFFEHCGCVYYRDLITQWILEGYFDPVRSVEKAYERGHSILMELINRGMLKIQENNVVVPEMAMSNLIDRRTLGLRGRSRLRFSNVYVGDKKKGIGKINQIDDMIKTVQAKKGDKISTILVSGDRLRRETPMKYFKKLDDLEVLGLFEPTVDSLVPALLELKKHLVEKKKEEEPYKELRVLVIRDCDLLEDIKDLITFRQLQVLEVSGASSLKEIDDDFFTEMPDLESLHLSGLQIKHSPSTISGLKKLHCLIIKDCPLLEDLPNIQGLLELEVVDISGARGLKTCFDNTSGNTKDKSKNKNFYKLEKLQHLDFSESQIERLPIFQDSADAKPLHSLTRLLLRNCSKLRRLPSLKPLSGLQILDLSGTTSLVEMLEVCFEDKKELTSLNLTGTNLGELATTINELSNLKELLLKDCTKLIEIPDIQNLTNLEVIDVSGSTEMNKIEGTFENMFYLRKVNLSGTNVVIAPESLPSESKSHGLKSFTQADGKCFTREKWSQIKEDIKAEKPEEASSSASAVKSQETTEKLSEEKREIQPLESHTSDSTEKVAVLKERLLQVPIDRTSESTVKVTVVKERLLHVPIDRGIYKKLQSNFASGSPQEVMEFNETNEFVEEALANVESVSFVDISPTRLTSLFNKINSVKGCWITMSRDIKDLFLDVEEARLESIETLSILNLPGLNCISRGGSFKNLKKLSIEYCLNIVTLFPEAAQLPGSLKELHIMYCEKLEKVFKEECEVPTLTTLCLVALPVLSAVGAKLPNLEKLDKRKCPKLPAEVEHLKTSEYVVVEHTDVPLPAQA